MQQGLILLFLMGECCLITCHLYEYHYITEKKTWYEAQKYCRDKFTDLATVSNMRDMKRVYELVKDQKEAWIGLYSNTDVSRTWHWSLPGVEFNDSETKWEKGEPNDKGEEGKLENCVVINLFLKWLDFPCTDTKPFFCYDENDTSKKFLLIKETKTWWDAQRYCRENHTDLVSGGEQQKQLESLIKDNNPNEILTALNLMPGGERVAFIGLFRDTWTWSDGNSFSFRHFRRHEDQNKKQCAATVKESEGWKNCDCTDKKPFICYKDKVILIQEEMNWEDALYYCRKHHHDLVSITNLDEQRWVQEKAKNATTPYVWTGLRYTCTLDFWFWVSDEAVCYKNWASGTDWDDCDMSGSMERGGKHQWFKKNDNEKFNFICSKS